MAKFRVTFETITEESAANGDADSRGYASSGGWQHNDPADLSLKDAIRACGHWSGGGFEDSGHWFSTMDADINYQTGEDTYYSIHPPRNITAASYRRVKRILCGK
jgi:hypothetical protein